MSVFRARRSDSRALFHARYTDGVIAAITGQTPTFTRAGEGYLLGGNGLYGRRVNARPRFDVWDGTVALLLEASQENLLLQAANVGAASSPWQFISGPLDVTAATSIIPGQTAYRHQGVSAASSGRFQAVGTLTGSPETAVMVVENVDATTSRMAIRDITVADWVILVTYTWSTGAIVVDGSNQGSSVSATAVSIGTGPSSGDLAVLSVTATPNNPGNTRQVYLYPVGTTANTDTAIIHYAGLHEDDFFGAVIPTAASAVTRAAESLYYAWSVPSTKACAAYVRFVAPATGSPALLRFGGSAPTLDIQVSVGGVQAFHNNGTSTVSSGTAGVTWDQGDEIEARLRYGSDGKVTAAVSVNGGTEVVGTQSAALSPGSLWGDARLYVGGLASEMASVSIREVKVASNADATMAELRAI